MFEKLVENILAEMVRLVNMHDLELLQRYPDDLLVHDKLTLESIAVPHSEFAWMVGHSHTHLVPLGLHTKEQGLVTHLTNFCNDDKFYHVKIGKGETFNFKEVDRNAFSALSNTPVPYERMGSVENFMLCRMKEKVGYVSLKMVGTIQDRKVEAEITPINNNNVQERAALRSWCKEAVILYAGTLFIKTEVTWVSSQSPEFSQ